MPTVNQRMLLAQRLSGQKLVIPDMRPVLSHWPCGQHENYEAVKSVVDRRFAMYVMEYQGHQVWKWTNFTPGSRVKRTEKLFLTLIPLSWLPGMNR